MACSPAAAVLSDRRFCATLGGAPTAGREPGREGDDETGAPRSGELRLDGSAMQLDDLPANVESKPDAPEVAAAVRLIEAIEDVLAALLRDPDAMIAYR